jgi:cell division protein ZapA (FtsZ GTPase activity inhibitor)
MSATAVTIYGRTYHLRGDGDPAYLEELASLVDSKMREVADITSTADTLKVAILASLNIADEYLKASTGAAPRETREAGRRLARLVTRLDEALAG